MTTRRSMRGGRLPPELAKVARTSGGHPKTLKVKFVFHADPSLRAAVDAYVDRTGLRGVGTALRRLVQVGLGLEAAGAAAGPAVPDV